MCSLQVSKLKGPFEVVDWDIFHDASSSKKWAKNAWNDVARN